MRASAFRKAVTVDRSNLLERFIELLRNHKIPFCLIGGQGVNAYVEPVVSLDVANLSQVDFYERPASHAS